MDANKIRLIEAMRLMGDAPYLVACDSNSPTLICDNLVLKWQEAVEEGVAFSLVMVVIH